MIKLNSNRAMITNQKLAPQLRNTGHLKSLFKKYADKNGFISSANFFAI
jgi:hypothetical protein